MPTADFFTRFGVFVIKDFFDADLCARLRSETRSNAHIQATVYKRIDRVDESARRTKAAKVSAQTISFVKERLLAVKPMLESHFNLTLTGCQEPQFLSYKEGDFFQPHQDSSDESDYAEYIKARQVSVVIFLNGETREPTPDSYTGGSLIFYGLMNDPRCQAIGFPLSGEAGLLIAFRSDIFHEVKTVTHGERYTIVSWLF